jgi:hypothetical protein
VPDNSQDCNAFPPEALELAALFSQGARELAWALSALPSADLIRHTDFDPENPEMSRNDGDGPFARLGVSVEEGFPIFLFSAPRREQPELAGSPMLVWSACSHLGEWVGSRASHAHQASAALAAIEAKARASASALLAWTPPEPPEGVDERLARAMRRRTGAKLFSESLRAMGFVLRPVAETGPREERWEMDPPERLAAPPSPEAEALLLALVKLRALKGRALARAEAVLMALDAGEAPAVADTSKPPPRL